MKSGWMSWVRTAAAGLALAAGMWAQGAGAAELNNVTANYAWPWGVGISYEVVGTISAHEPLFVWAKDLTDNTTYLATAEALSGDVGREAGTHHVVWDLEKQGIKLQSTNVIFTVAYEWPLYCVVNLEWAYYGSYAVTYMNELSARGFTLVLRRIDPGTFKMGGRYQTTLTKPYYIGIYEVTQKQYQLVTGDEPSKWGYGSDPVEQVSWNTIRGNSSWPASSDVSANSFIGRLRAGTGLAFDLPTEAQWEYACRAGTTSAYNNGGNTTNDLNQLGRYNDNRGKYDCHEFVGSFQPNAWGLYDMHGNVWEWCLDWYGNLTDRVTDPKGAASGSNRVIRGGGWDSSASACTSSFRNDMNPSAKVDNCGFRLVINLAE